MFTNPRLGMSAHLEGVLNGMFLIVLGLIWKEVNLPRRAATAAYGLVLYGAFVNWAATLLGAGFGTHRLTPIAGAGYAGTAWQENLVATLVVSMVLSMAAGAALLLWGLVRRSA
jgi:hydroxylaminobenzene mutase